MTSTPGQQTPDGPPVIVIDDVPRSAEDLKAMAREQAIVISDLLEAKFAHTIDDYWLQDDGTAFLRYSARGEMILWEVSIRTVRAARLAKTIRTGQDDDHAIELAEARNEISRLREDLALRTRDFQDCVAVNAQLFSQVSNSPVALGEQVSAEPRLQPDLAVWPLRPEARATRPRTQPVRRVAASAVSGYVCPFDDAA